MANSKLLKLLYLFAGVVCTCLLLWQSYSKATVKVITRRRENHFLSKWNISNVNNQFHLVTMLSLYCGHRWPGYEKFSMGELAERDEEYLVTLQSNLNHPLVKRLHLFYTEDGALQTVHRQKMLNMQKIIPVKMERRVHMMDFFHYASTFLLNESIIALNGDIVVGEGFDLIDTEKMRDEKVLYTLTRHGHRAGNCSVDNYCLDLKYQGSHDTHVFRLAQPLNASLLIHLDYPINMWQAENGMIGAFKHFFNFKVYNPCKTLKTYHHHCSPVHKQGRTYSIKDPPYKWDPSLLAKAQPTADLLY